MTVIADLRTKKCSKCGDDKPVSAFSKDSKGRLGVKSLCKICDVERLRRSAQTIEAKEKRCVACSALKPAAAFYRQPYSRDGLGARCRPCHADLNCRSKKVRSAARRAASEAAGRPFKDVAWKEAEAERRKLQAAKRQEQKMVEAAERRELSRLREKIKNQIKKQRRKGNIDWLVRDGLARGRRPASVMKTLGYSIDELRRHIERQFSRGMSWEAFSAGRIHIDHIIPVRLFDLSTGDGVKACWAMTNLRPMWAEDNIAKGGNRTLLI